MIQERNLFPADGDDPVSMPLPDMDLRWRSRSCGGRRFGDFPVQPGGLGKNSHDYVADSAYRLPGQVHAPIQLVNGFLHTFA